MPSNDTQLINALVRRHINRRPLGRPSFLPLPFLFNQYVVPNEIQQLIKIKARASNDETLSVLTTLLKEYTAPFDQHHSQAVCILTTHFIEAHIDTLTTHDIQSIQKTLNDLTIQWSQEDSNDRARQSFRENYQQLHYTYIQFLLSEKKQHRTSNDSHEKENSLHPRLGKNENQCAMHSILNCLIHHFFKIPGKYAAIADSLYVDLTVTHINRESMTYTMIDMILYSIKEQLITYHQCQNIITHLPECIEDTRKIEANGQRLMNALSETKKSLKNILPTLATTKNHDLTDSTLLRPLISK